MKIIKTSNFLKISQDYQTGISLKKPDDQRGSELILKEDDTSIDTIKKKWKDKRIPRTHIFKPYQKAN